MNFFKSTFSKMKHLGWKRNLALFILAAADVFMIAAPYYLKSIVPNLQQYLHIEEHQVSTMTAILGGVTLLTQLPGGWLADKFSSRKMVSISVFLTGILTIWFGFLALNGAGVDNETLASQYYIIFALWGVTTTPLFWTPLWKLVSQQTEKEDQGLAYGLQGSYNGFVGVIFIAILGTVATVLTAKFASTSYKYVPFATFVFMIAALLMILGVLTWIFVEEKPTSEKFAINTKTLFNVMKDWKVWALSFFVMGMYMFQSTFSYYLNQMLANVVLVPTLALTIIAGFRLYGLRMAISGFVGRFADKFKSITLLLIGVLFVGFILVTIFIFLPGVSSDPTINSFATYSDEYKQAAMVLMVILLFASAFLSWIMVTLRYAQTAEIYRPKNSYGAVSAVLSFIGFSSDAWFYQIAGEVSKNYKDPITKTTTQGGYQIILGLGIAVAFIGLLFGLAVYLSNYKFNNKLKINYFRWRDLNNA
ncbi:MFS transporter [Mycoplasmopsis alligatoris]|uniref:Putative ATP synthase F0, A subunit n=1 Tax=Mycoplasmopsis alligatoris A21JP2 TaxID=747682 RepID=D4XVE9_9BACT|nr:MFS transporter [Mycoplasmopsis alligatoris]EFF41636.1 putative ATP synthase F0, A subunit [Mycoplasmopsis alligatoris A21JP2]